MSEEKQPKERPGTTALPKPVALANTRNTVPARPTRCGAGGKKSAK